MSTEKIAETAAIQWLKDHVEKTGFGFPCLTLLTYINRLRDALVAVDSEIVLEGQLKELVDEALDER